MNQPFDPPLANIQLEAGPSSGSPRAAMDYFDAYKSFFESPRWGTNLLMLGVCGLIPLVGIIAIQGYLASVVARRHTHGEVIAAEFDFNNLGLYIGRGIWSFLASLIVAAAAIPFVGATMGLIVFTAGSGSEAAPIAAAVGAAVVFLVFGVVMFLLMRPILLRATFFQSLEGVFSLTFVRDYVQRMWLEMFLSQLFMFATMIPLALVGYLMCGVGIYPAIALMSFATAQLDLQLYEVYLSRGGTAIPIQPKLLDTPVRTTAFTPPPPSR